MASSSPPDRLRVPIDPWSQLHVNSCLGRAVRVDGSWVFTGEGYDPTTRAPPARRSSHRAEDLVAFPPQFPLQHGNGPLGRLGSGLSPRFADRHFELRYQEHRGQRLDSVQLYFAAALTCYCSSLWAYHLSSARGLDHQSRIGISLMHAALAVAWLFWAVLRAIPRARACSSALHGVQISIIVAIFCWGMPATARPTCSDMYSSFDANLQCTILVALCYAAVFCRIGTSSFALLCLATLANFLAARSFWSALDEEQPFVAAFEAPKLMCTLFILAAGVRRTDVHLRRDFAAREVMLMLIQEQGQEIRAKKQMLQQQGPQGRRPPWASLPPLPPLPPLPGPAPPAAPAPGAGVQLARLPVAVRRPAAVGTDEEGGEEEEEEALVEEASPDSVLAVAATALPPMTLQRPALKIALKAHHHHKPRGRRGASSRHRHAAPPAAALSPPGRAASLPPIPEQQLTPRHVIVPQAMPPEDEEAAAPPGPPAAPR